MDEKNLSAGRRRRAWLDLLVSHYRPKNRRPKIPTVKNWGELVILAAQNKPPSRIKIILNGEKFLAKLTKTRGKTCYSILGHA